jgi:hypothetical protein
VYRQHKRKQVDSQEKTESQESMSGRRAGGRRDGVLGFNPRLIFAQICSLQCFHYLFLGFLFQVNNVFYGTSITLDRIFTDNYIELWSWGGWSDNSAILLSSVLGSILLAIIVEKAKKCLDFTVTLFLIHLLLCIMYDGVPSTWDWWIVTIMGTIIMTLLGEHLCAKKELDDIPMLQL